MKLTKYDVNKLGELSGRRKANLFEILYEFCSSGMDCAKVEDYPHKNAKSCQSCLIGSAKRFGFNVKVVTRGDDVFLLKKVGKKE